MINKKTTVNAAYLEKKKKRKRKQLKTHWASEQNRKKRVAKNVENTTVFLFKKHRYFATQAIIDISKSNGIVNVVTMVEMTVLC